MREHPFNSNEPGIASFRDGATWWGSATSALATAGTSKRLSRAQIIVNTRKEAEEFVRKGIDPYVYTPQRQPDDSVKRALSTTTFESKKERYRATYPDVKRRRCFTSMEARALHQFAPDLHYFCGGKENLFWGVVNGGPACLASEVGERGANIVSSLKCFFQNTSYDVDHICTVLHDEQISTIENGIVLFHVHAHFIFVCRETGKSLRKFEKALRRRFPIGGAFGLIDSPHAMVNYILRTPDRAPLVRSGEFVPWADSIRNRRRIFSYGRFRKARAAWTGVGLLVKRKGEFFFLADRPKQPQRLPRSGHGPKPVEPNTIVGKATVGPPSRRFEAQIIKNAQPASVETAASFLCTHYSTSKCLVFSPKLPAKVPVSRSLSNCISKIIPFVFRRPATPSTGPP